jgi:hypothetical protein
MLFAAVVAVTVGATGYYLYRVRAQTASESPAESAPFDLSDRARLQEIQRRSYMAFRNMRPGPGYGKFALASLFDRDARVISGHNCNRIYFSASAGLCLAVATHPAGFRAYLLDASLNIAHTIEIPGTPSRARVASDGRLAAYTVFVGVDSYLAAGLSTRTRLLDVRSGSELADLETFDVLRDGRSITAADFNFWGVTFTRDPSHFYATLATGGRTFLVEGHLERRTLHVIADDIECPSLSPDGSRIAFKKKFGAGLGARWQPAILDLTSKTIHLLPEPRHVDDQIEWLDDAHVLYGLGHSLSASVRRSDVWELAADGSSAPVLFLADAESPAIVRR